jgi:hypothetical protein
MILLNDNIAFTMRSVPAQWYGIIFFHGNYFNIL